METVKKERGLLSKQKRRGKPIMFDENQYTDFMTNISKRKQERKLFGLAMQRKKDRANRLAARKDSRKAVKNAIEEHFGEIIVDEDGAITYTKMPFEDPTQSTTAAAADSESEDEDEEVEDLRFEDDNALIVVETTDMQGKKVQQKNKTKMTVSDIISATAADEDEDEEEEEEEEEEVKEEESEASEDDAVARSNRMMALVRKFGGNISDDEDMAEESEEEIVAVSSNPNKTKIVKKEELKAKAAKDTKKETKAEKVKAVKEEKMEEKKEEKKTKNEDKEVKKEKKKDVKEEKKEKEEKKKQTKKETKMSEALAKEKAMYNSLLVEKVDETQTLIPVAAEPSFGPARPTLEDALFSLPKPSHWEADKYRRAAIAEAQAMDAKNKGKKKPTKDDSWNELKVDNSYGWEEGEGSNVKDFGLINGMPPACMGGRHRKKPLSKKKDNSHNARNERKRAREKEDEDKKTKAAFEDGQSTGHGFGYDSDDEEDLLLLGKHNKKRKMIEAKRKAKTSVMEREGVSRKAYFFGSKDNTISF